MQVAAPNIRIEDALADAKARYVAANPLSAARHAAAKAALPGGNTRSSAGPSTSTSSSHIG